MLPIALILEYVVVINVDHVWEQLLLVLAVLMLIDLIYQIVIVAKDFTMMDLLLLAKHALCPVNLFNNLIYK